jgi:RNA-directed DNA polymerase
MRRTKSVTLKKDMRICWTFPSLLEQAEQWYLSVRAKVGIAEETHHWWPFSYKWKSTVKSCLSSFIAGAYVFSPMKQYCFPEETIRIWCYSDRLMVRLLFLILKPCFKHIIPATCHSLKGPGAIQGITKDIKVALDSGAYHFAMRIDIRSYYASIDHGVLLKQLAEVLDDKRVLHYLNAIVTIAIDKEGIIFRPQKGIPLRSALSPFFGALALAPLDKAFSGKDVFYSRYQDDIIILIKTKNQFIKAKKLLFKVLGSLHLAISPEKTRLGRLKDFHFLGVKFEVSQNPQEKTQSTATMHPRSCARALEKVKTLRANAVHTAHIQRYLMRWAGWWHCVAGWTKLSLLTQWVEYTGALAPDTAWIGSGLLPWVGVVSGCCGHDARHIQDLINE